MATRRKIRRVPGITQQTAEILARHNVTDCKDVLCLNELELMKFTGQSYNKVKQILKTVSHAIIPKLATGMEMRGLLRETTGFFSTSLSQLDDVLHGGLPKGTITEIAGPAGCGKTQFCIMLSVLACLPQNMGGLGGGVIYIDTEAAFTAERLVEVAKSRFPGYFKSWDKLQELTRNVHLNIESTCAALWTRLGSIEEDIISKNIKLVILDSVASLVRKEYDTKGTKNITERTALLSREAAKLKYLAESFNIPVIVTNQITTRFSRLNSGHHVPSTDLDSDGMELDLDEGGGTVTAALGNTWSHAVNTRLIVQYVDEKFRQVMISKSPVAPFRTFTYTIESQGIVLSSDHPGENERGVNPSLQQIRVRTAVT